MSSFPIFSIAAIAASEFPCFESLSILPRATGTICHDTPNRSVSQPHGPFSPPAESFSQSRSISPWVRHSTMKDIPIENENAGPPSNAVNSRPKRTNDAPTSFPFGMGPPLLRDRLRIFDFGKREM